MIKVKKLTSHSDRLNGLIGKKPKAVLLVTRFGVHTFGMEYPLDIVVLNKQFIAVKIKKSLSPNRLFFWNPKYKYLMELPAGTIKKEGIKIGKKVIIEIV